MAGTRNTEVIAAFGVVLRELRTAAGMTQEQLAGLAGVDRTYVGLLETGIRQPSLTVICAIAYAVGQTPPALLSKACDLAATSNAG